MNEPTQNQMFAEETPDPNRDQVDANDYDDLLTRVEEALGDYAARNAEVSVVEQVRNVADALTSARRLIQAHQRVAEAAGAIALGGDIRRAFHLVMTALIPATPEEGPKPEDQS